MGHAPNATLFYGIVEPEADAWSTARFAQELDGDDQIPDLGVERGFYGAEYCCSFLAITESQRDTGNQPQIIPDEALMVLAVWEERLRGACQRLNISIGPIGWYLVVAW